MTALEDRICEAENLREESKIPRLEALINSLDNSDILTILEERIDALESADRQTMTK